MSYRTETASAEYWQRIKAERKAEQAKQRSQMKAYNAARKAWEQSGKVGKQPSLKDFQQ